MEFKNYTCHMNRGFKINLEGIVVSVAFHDYFATESFDENHNCIVTHKISDFTFNQAEVCIFDNNTDENLTEQFIQGMDGFDESEQVLHRVSPYDLVLILQRVKEFKSQ